MILTFIQKFFPAVTLGLLLFSQAFAGTPLILNHQGRLLDSGDAPISGPVDLEFRIYETPTGGVPLWSETHPAVSVQDGLFAVNLGGTTPIPADLLAQSSTVPMDRYLEVVVQGAAISPRLRLSSVPYAVASSRISGDVETRHGELAVVEGGVQRTKLASLGSVCYVGTWDASSDKSNLLYTDSDSTGLVIGDSQGSLIRLQGNVGINEPIPDTKLHIGDIDRDGYPDVVVASNSNERSIAIHEGNNPFVVSSNDDSTFLAMKHNPLNRPAYMNFTCTFTDGRAALKSEFKNGDIPDQNDRVAMITTDSSRAEEVLAANFSSDGTAHVVTKKYVDVSDAAVEVATIGNGTHSNNANIAATLNGNVVIGARVHTDNSGTPSNSGSIEVDDARASSKIVGGKGFYYVVSSASDEIGEGASHVVATDPNHNAIYNGSIWQKVDNSDLVSSVGFDIDEDGTDDVGSQTSAKVTRSILKTYFERQDIPTQSRLIHTADSLGASSTVEIDVDGDGNNDGGGGILSIKDRTDLKLEFQNGDIPDQDDFLQARCDAVGSSLGMRVPSAMMTWGKGLTLRVDDEVQSLIMDQDSLPTFSVKSTASSTECRLTKAIRDGDTKLSLSAGQSDCTMQLGDVNSDGYAELTTSSGTSGLVPQSTSFRMGRPTVNTALIHTDPSSSSITLSHASSGPGDKPTAAQFGNLIDSYMHLEDDGVIRFSAESSTGLQLRDQFGNVRMSATTEGIGVFDQKIGVGKTPTEKIDVAGGAYCDGTNWVNASDRNAKENFEDVNGEELLSKLAELEITEWNYKGNESDKHIGPTAQDFQKAFGVGSDGKSISTIDPSGIALAAIKELYKQFSDEMKKKDAQIEQLQKQLQELKKTLKTK